VKQEACVADKVDEEFATVATLATHDEESAANTLDATKNHVNVELAKKTNKFEDKTP
jgi:hypothetical protein